MKNVNSDRYEKPSMEELNLVIEGSFLEGSSQDRPGHEGGEIDGEGDENTQWP